MYDRALVLGILRQIDDALEKIRDRSSRISQVPNVQIVCNSELDSADVAVSKHARETALSGTLE